MEYYKRGFKSYLIIIILFIAVIFLSLYTSSLLSIPDSNKELYLSEIMSGNKNTIKDMDNEYSDYIEIYNPSDNEINLKGYYLSDDNTSSKKWMFPEITIKGKEYLVVFASGKDKCDLNIRECHTNFKLSKGGELITILDNDGSIIDKVNYSKMNQDTSYSLVDGNYYLTMGTPSRENDKTKSDQVSKADIIINEVTIDEPESIEIKNLLNKDLDLSGYVIQDKSGKDYKFSNTKIKAKSFLVLYCDDKRGLIDNKIYTGFKISNSNEILYLYNKDGRLIDTFHVGKLKDGISKGRNEKLETVIYKKKTMGLENDKNAYQGFSVTPIFSINGGYVDKGTKVSLKTNDNSEIYYTLDGSTPTTKSKKYDGEITINSTTVIRAISYKKGYLESDIESRTFIVGRKHNLPVISISTDHNKIYGSNGIFTKGPNAASYYPYKGANFWKDIEVPISFELYENGSLGLDFYAGMKVFGGWSRGEAQKSVTIYLRKKYGLQEITYHFFDDNVNTYSKFILRSGGQDFGKLKLKDAFLQEV
ncbi:MAG: lamin tail domain-containing protein, partial [Bacilli bacterium]|nr:lamin tail domain-containing protein [Bacilli bacterium]